MIRSALASDDVNALVDDARVPGVRIARAREIIEAATREGRCLVSVDDQLIEGYVVTSRRSFFGRDFIVLLAVRDDRRRRGIARALLRAAGEASSSETIFVSTNESNAGMRNLLEDEGWTYSGTLSGIDEGDPERVYFRNALG